jgi:hypothetical protein
MHLSPLPQKLHTLHIIHYIDINYASLISGYKLTNTLALKSKLRNITKPDTSKSNSMVRLMNVHLSQHKQYVKMQIQSTTYSKNTNFIPR